MIINATDVTFEDEVLAVKGERILVDFWATWCGPCRALGLLLNQVAAENPALKIVKVDVDANPALAAQFGIMKVPTLVVFEDGALVWYIDRFNKATITKALQVAE